MVRNIFPYSLRYALKALADEECQKTITKLIEDDVICGIYTTELSKLENGNIVEKVIIDGNLCFRLSEFGKRLIRSLLEVVK